MFFGVVERLGTLKPILRDARSLQNPSHFIHLRYIFINLSIWQINPHFQFFAHHHIIVLYNHHNHKPQFSPQLTQLYEANYDRSRLASGNVAGQVPSSGLSSTSCSFACCWMGNCTPCFGDGERRNPEPKMGCETCFFYH